MTGDILSYEDSEMADGFEKIASDITYEGVGDESITDEMVDEMTPEQEKLKKEAAQAMEGTARMKKRNGDASVSASPPVDPATTQDVDDALYESLWYFENDDF